MNQRTPGGAACAAGLAALGLALPLAILSPGDAAAQARKYQVKPPAKNGSIAGTVTLEGTPPPPRKFLINKNKEVCGRGMKAFPTITLEGKAINEVVVYVSGIKAGKDWPAKKAYAVNNSTCVFEPHVQAMPVNETLVVVNSDPILHNTHSYLKGITVINLGLPIEGMKVPKKMTRPGMMRVECDAHNWMQAWVYIADNPYYAVTADGGRYEIDGLPPGSYTVTFWQEALGEQTRSVTVEPGRKVTVDVVMQGK